MDSNLQKYQAFLKAVECSSFTRAAEALGYTQSSVSKMIADLEQEWHVTLLERSRGGVQITADGMALLPYAQALINDYRLLLERVADLNGLQQGLIRIGVFSSVATHWMPNIIQAFQKDYPGIQYELLLGDYAEIEGWIAQGRVDCGFLRLPTRPDLKTVFVEEDEYFVILPENHCLTEKKEICPEDLNGERFLLLEHGGKTDLSEYLDRCGIRPDIRFTTWDDYAIMSMVEKGLGIAILPRLILQRTPYRLEIRSLTRPLVRKIALAMRSQRTTSAAVERFVQYLQYRSIESA